MRKKELTIELICCAFILLFVYAAVSKIIDRETFSIALHKSPMLTDYADVVVVIVPLFEIIIAVLLVFSATRIVGLYASFVTMMLFTFYIIAILMFSEYLPCTCGGVLEKMSWRQHLIFNIVFVALSILALRLRRGNRLRSVSFLLSGSASSLLIVYFIYTNTYHELDKYSSFYKRPGSARVVLTDSINLRYNSYHFAGTFEDGLVLGNGIAPLHFVSVNTATFSPTSHSIRLPDSISDFRGFKLKVIDGDFFLANGTIPLIYTGRIDELNAQRYSGSYGYFNEFIPSAHGSLIFRVIDSTNTYSLANVTPTNGFKIKPGILTRQIDGKFCEDGVFSYNREKKKIVYTYFYRNRFITMDAELTHHYNRKTIDTVSTAEIKVSSITSNGITTSVVVPIVKVNRQCFTYREFVFVWSNLRAKNESTEEFRSSARVDVYMIYNGSYLLSFNIPTPTAGLRELQLVDGSLFSLTGENLLRYNIDELLSECEEAAKRNLPAGKQVRL